MEERLELIFSSYSGKEEELIPILQKVQEEFGSFETYIWEFVAGKPIQNTWQSISEIPAKTELSEAISKDLKKRGFSFVGPTITYAFMQATGIVNDHTVDCFRYDNLSELIWGASRSISPLKTTKPFTYNTVLASSGHDQ